MSACGVLESVFLWNVRALNHGTFEGPLTFDDGYTYLAAARTFAETGRLAVSPHHPALAAITSPVYALILAGAGKVADLERLALVFGIACAAACVACCFFALTALGRDLPYPRLFSFGLTLLLACSGLLSFHALTGMETTMMLASTLAAWLAYVRVGPGWHSGLASALAAVLRPDGLLLPLAVAVAEALEIPRCDPASRRARTRSLVRYLCPPLLAAGAQSALLLWYANAVVPRSVGARMLLYCWGSSPLSRRITTTGQEVALLFGPLPFVGGIALLGAAVSFARTPAKSDLIRAARALSIFAAALVGVFVASGVSAAYHNFRYATPLYPCAILLTGVAFARMLRAAPDRRFARGVATAVLLGVVLHALYGLSAGRRPFVVSRATFAAINSAYQAGLRWLEQVSEPGAVVAVTDIGQATYYLPRRIFDLAGLADAEMLPYFRDARTNACVPPGARDLSDVAARFRFDYIVVDARWWYRFLPGLITRNVAAVRQVGPTRIFAVTSQRGASSRALGPRQLGGDGARVRVRRSDFGH